MASLFYNSFSGVASSRYTSDKSLHSFGMRLKRDTGGSWMGAATAPFDCTLFGNVIYGKPLRFRVAHGIPGAGSISVAIGNQVI